MYIDKSKKIVIKIGSSILIDKKGKPKKSWLKGFVQDVKLLIKKKKTSSACFIRSHCAWLRISWNQKKGFKNR
jgi:hypothetical protein